jgi:hypothetical protein
MACRNEDDYNDTEQRALHSDFKDGKRQRGTVAYLKKHIAMIIK